MTGHDEYQDIAQEELMLRNTPRPVTRINKRVLVFATGVGILLLFGAAMVALDPPQLRDSKEKQRELYPSISPSRPEGLEKLPRKYGNITQRSVQLGAPLPGDLGSAVLGIEQELGIEGMGNTDMPLPFRPDAEQDALRAERIRQARLAQQGREAGVFFELGMRKTDSQEKTTSMAPPAMPYFNPFEATLNPNASAKANGLAVDLVNDQNRHKLGFMEKQADADIYNPYTLQEPVSKYQVMAGTIIAASLITGINSDLPGQVIAQVTEHVYDTVTGQYLLIPQGSKVIGTYDSVVAFGQERALVVWQRIIMPGGTSIQIENLPATDTAGYAGLQDQVDFHSWRLLKGIALSTLLGVSTELTLGEEESDLVKAIRQSTQNTVAQVGEKITERNLKVQPTITIRPGWPVRIIVNKDMVLQVYSIKRTG